ncbi:MipA/OmpV family protein [Shigella flexneri]
MLLYFKAKDSGNHQMRHLTTVTAPRRLVCLTLTLPSTVTCVPPSAGDTLENSNGIVWDTALLYRYTNGGLTVTPGIGVQWSSENQTEYYYGVSRRESLAAVCVAITRTTAGALTWSSAPATTSSAMERLRYRALYRLSDEVTDSPMVDKSWTGLISTGIT